MAKNNQSIFAEDSDEGSVNTTTTPGSENDSDQEYEVEKVLAENIGADGRMHYLLKWAGYPLYRCTWERKENITHEILLQEWETEKSLARQGQRALFDVSIWEEAVERFMETQEKKRERREAKRRKRGLLGKQEESDYDEDLPITETPKRTRIKTSPLKRKGVAQPVTKKRSKIHGVVGEADELAPDSGSSDVDSLVEEPKKDVSTQVPPNSRIPAATTSASSASKAKAADPTAGSSATGMKTLLSKQPTKPTSSNLVNVSKTITPVSKVGPSSTAARKSAPTTSSTTTATAKHSAKPNIFTADWAQEKRRRQRQRVSGETPKDSTDPKFTRLSIQNRYQKYGNNEPAPDPNALAMIDPKTGRVELPKPTTTQIGAGEIHSAYGRRTPPQPSKARSPSPQSARPSETEVRVEPPQPVTSRTLSSRPDNAAPSVSILDINPHTWRKSVTCKHWLAGGCRYTAETCRYDHGYTDGKKKQITCHYWKHGPRCKFTAEQCEFAHEDTGVYAGPPGSYKSRLTGINAIKESDLMIMNTTSLPTSEPVNAHFIEPPPPPPPPPPSLQTNIEPLATSFASNQVEPSPAITPVDVPTDPRLRGRPSFTSATKVMSPSKPQSPDQARETFVHTPVYTHGEEPNSLMHGAVEADLAMAKRGLRHLDANRLLAPHNGNDIENIYIHMPDRPGELALLKDYFEGLQRKVYTSDAGHAWDYFRNRYGKCCLVIVHPSEMFTGTIPGLNKLLVETGAGMKVFSIGVQHEQCIREERQAAYEAQRLFPHGGITFITDDVFAYYPDKATDIIEKFLNETKTKPPGAELSKIGARPGVMDWLMRLAIQKFEEHGGEGNATDMRYIQCYEALCRLCPLEDEDPDFPDHHVPLKTSHLWSIWEDSLPSFKGRWESGEEEEATAYMANLFAGEARCKAWKYRKFYFVYQRPDGEETITNSQGHSEVQKAQDPEGWGKRYCHVNVVTPDQVLKKKR